jgi:hypothetical protein
MSGRATGLFQQSVPRWPRHFFTLDPCPELQIRSLISELQGLNLAGPPRRQESVGKLGRSIPTRSGQVLRPYKDSLLP